MCLTALGGEASTCHPLLGDAVSHPSFSTPALISLLPLVFRHSAPGTPLKLYPCLGISRNPPPQASPQLSPPAPQALLPSPLPSQLLPPSHRSYLPALRVTPAAGPAPSPAGEAPEALSQSRCGGWGWRPRTLPPAPQPAPLTQHQQLGITIWQHVFLLRVPPSRGRGSLFRRSPQHPCAQARR